MSVVILLLQSILGFLSVYLLILFWNRRRLISKLSWIPGPPAFPIIGNYFDLTAPPPEVAFENMKAFREKYGKTYKVWIGTTPMIFTHDLDIIQKLFKTDDNVRRPYLYNMLRYFLGGGLLFGEGGDKWKMLRRYLSESSFHADILDQHLQPLDRKVKVLMKILEKETEKSKPVDLIKFFKPCFLDISCASTTGVEIQSLEDPPSCPYLDAVESMSDIVMARVLSPILKINCLFNLTGLKNAGTVAREAIESFVKKTLSERLSMTKIDYEDKKRKIIIDAMIEIKKKNDDITNSDVTDNISNHIFASYDTLSTVSSFLLFLLANHPDIQDEVLKEIDSVVPNLLEEGITLKDVTNLKLLDRCVKEALRMFPPAPMIGRRATNPIPTDHGTIPAGVDIYINMHSYHMNKDVYQNPEAFDPDRFLPENVSKRHPLSWMPFGLGLRICIGQKQAVIQCKAAVAMMVKKFVVKPYESTKDLKLIANVVMKSRDGVRVYLQPRNS